MSQTILVADDEPHLARFIQGHLERAGYRVRTALGGQSALDAVTAATPDLLVCDYEMPDVNGFEVLKQLRQSPTSRDIPVVMLRPKLPTLDVFRGLQSRFDCSLTKPFNPEELVAFVRRIFKAQEDANEAEQNSQDAG